jgi:hypothetical protein
MKSLSLVAAFAAAWLIASVDPLVAGDAPSAAPSVPGQAPAPVNPEQAPSLIPPNKPLPAEAYPPPPPTSDVLQDLWARQAVFEGKYGLDDHGYAGLLANCPCHFFVDAGFYMIHPYFSHNPAFITAHRQGTSPAVSQTTDFDYEVEFGPHVSFGVTGPCGFGFRSSWWQFDFETSVPAFPSQDATLRTAVSSTPVPGVPGFTSPGSVARAFGVFGDQVGFGNHVRGVVWDWEATKEFTGGCWAMLVAGGMRYGYLSQSYSASRFNSGSGRSGTSRVTIIEDSDTIVAGRNFGGVGPTTALEIRRQIGSFGLAVYGNARGSVLFGDEKAQTFQRTVENQRIIPSRGPTQTVMSTTLVQHSAPSEDTLPMADFEVGVSWTKVAGRARIFFQAGLVNQTWFDAGSATTEEGHFGFYGLRCTAGFSY